MRLTFLGAASTVTGSKYLLEVGDLRFLVDCGLYQGFKQLRLRNWQPLPVPPSAIDAVILTHAHIDHSGYLPLLVRQGFRGPVYCTQATKELCAVLLPDAGFLEERDADFANRHGFSKHRPALPLFTEADGRAAVKRLMPKVYDETVSLAPGVEATLRNAGHLLGAASVLVASGETRIVFSGDIGRPDDPVMLPPAMRDAATHVVVESTYGDRLHGSADPVEALEEVVVATARRGGSVLVPTFAVGRAQTVLLYLHRLKRAGRIPDLPVFLDSPMAIDATGIFETHAPQHRLSAAEIRAVCSLARFTRSAEESKAIALSRVPSIILAASGMATGGRVLHHLRALAPDHRNSIVLCGFQAPGTRGAALRDGARQIKIHGAYVPIEAEVVALPNMSSHADVEGLLAWLNSSDVEPRDVFVTHGEPAAADSLRHKVEEELGWRCGVPAYRDQVEL